MQQNQHGHRTDSDYQITRPRKAVEDIMQVSASLLEEGARDAILIPGEGLFNVDEKDSIVEAIISKSRNDDGSISTNIISLLCSRIYVDFKKSGADHISPSLVDNFIKGNPFERFYHEATQGFSNKEKSYIEDNLVDSTGRRNSIPESNFHLFVKNGSKLLEGKNNIFQKISNGSNETIRIELIHDSFCESLLTHRQKRLQRHKLYKTTSIILILFICLLFSVLYLNVREKDRLESKRKSIETELAKVEAERAKVEAERAKVEADNAKLEAERAMVEVENAKLEAEKAKLETEKEKKEKRKLKDELRHIMNNGLIPNQSQAQQQGNGSNSNGQNTYNTDSTTGSIESLSKKEKEQIIINR